jgi:hypothetical protein
VIHTFGGPTESCHKGHDLVGANGLRLPDGQVMCRKCRGVGNRSYGYESHNERGQVWVFVPDHPRSRKDGFYARARLVAERDIGRVLEPGERVYHENEAPGDDRPENLRVFASQAELASHRALRSQPGKERIWKRVWAQS